MAVIDVSKVDTTPGNDAVCPFSPPEGWEGDSAAYVELCRHLCSGKQAGQNSLGPNGTTANLCSITAEIHRFKELLIWFCEY